MNVQQSSRECLSWPISRKKRVNCRRRQADSKDFEGGKEKPQRLRDSSQPTFGDRRTPKLRVGCFGGQRGQPRPSGIVIFLCLDIGTEVYLCIATPTKLYNFLCVEASRRGHEDSHNDDRRDAWKISGEGTF